MVYVEVLDHYLAITPGSDLVEVVTDADRGDGNVGECAASVPPVEANDQGEVDLGMSASCRSRLDFDSFSD
jgi:hypothetical protein